MSAAGISVAALIRNTLRAYYLFNQGMADAGDTSAAHHTFLTVFKDCRLKNGVLVRRHRRQERPTGRLARVSEHNCEAQAYRILLLHTPAPTGPNDLKRIPSDPPDVAVEVLEARSFVEAAREREPYRKPRHLDSHTAGRFPGDQAGAAAMSLLRRTDLQR